jgi:hypothetical protein
MDTSFPSLNNDIIIANSLKQSCNEQDIVLVGPPASQFSEQILENKSVDFVARWEYDFTLLDLIKKRDENASLEDIK